jgi:hypothetical protein
LEPAKRLRGPLDEPVANRAFADLDALAAVLAERRRELERRRAARRGRTRYRRWPRERHRRRQ